MLYILTLAAAKVKARSNPTRIASYLTSLLEAGKPSRIVCSSCSLVGDCKTRLIPELEALDALSTWRTHYHSSGDSMRWDGCWETSAIKSAMTCHFITSLGWYLISYLLNSMTYLSILLDKSGLCRMLLSGWFVSTVTWCAWKYEQSFWVMLFKVKVVCSILEYRVSASTIDLLT